MNDVHFYRNAAYRNRRVAFLLRVIAILWSITMAGVFIVNMGWISFFTATLGSAVIGMPVLLLVEVCEARAENYLFLARKAKAETPLLGVVAPKAAAPAKKAKKVAPK
jgi:hypothetical protein